ncbi:MAG: hypothetical protein RSA54_06295 [Glutamicibacter sp.]
MRNDGPGPGQRKDTDLYFTQVLSAAPDTALLLGHLYMEGHEPSITRVMLVRDGTFYFLYDLPDIIYGTTLLPATDERPFAYALLGRRGLLRIHPTGQAPWDETLVLPNAYLMHLQQIDGALYACGTQRQVHQRGVLGWQRMDADCHAPLRDQVTCCFNAMDGVGPDDIYAAGDAGALWHWDGQQWQSLPSPTALTIRVVHCMPDGSVVLAGDAGAVFRGNRVDGWQTLSVPAFEHLSVERACLFQGTLYLCAQRELLALSADGLARVDVPLAGPLAYYSASATDGAMWTVGDDAILRFDGANWSRFICP